MERKNNKPGRLEILFGKEKGIVLVSRAGAGRLLLTNGIYSYNRHLEKSTEDYDSVMYWADGFAKRWEYFNLEENGGNNGDSYRAAIVLPSQRKKTLVYNPFEPTRKDNWESTISGLRNKGYEIAETEDVDAVVSRLNCGILGKIMNSRKT